MIMISYTVSFNCFSFNKKLIFNQNGIFIENLKIQKTNKYKNDQLYAYIQTCKKML